MTDKAQAYLQAEMQVVRHRINVYQAEMQAFCEPRLERIEEDEQTLTDLRHALRILRTGMTVAEAQRIARLPLTTVPGSDPAHCPGCDVDWYEVLIDADSEEQWCQNCWTCIFEGPNP